MYYLFAKYCIKSVCLTLYLLVSSTDNFCKHLWPKLFDTVMVSLENYLGTYDFEKKNQQTTKDMNDSQRAKS